MSDFLTLLPILLLYVVGYLMLFIARSWSGYFGVVISGGVLWALVAFALFITTAFRMEGVVVAIFLTPLFIGMVAGAVVKPVLLVTKWRTASARGLLILVAGLALLPGGLAIWRAAHNYEIGQFYERLPTAETLPQIPACAPFRGAGPVIGTVRTVRGADGTERLLRLRFPAAYDVSLRDHDYIPSPGDAGRTFKAGILDGRPLTHADEEDADGNRLPPEGQTPWVLFHVDSDPPDTVGGLAYPRFREWVAGLTPGALARKPSDPTGLVETVRPEEAIVLGEEDYFVAMTGDRPTGHLGCWKTDPVRYSVCLFAIEHGGSILSGSFRRIHLERWPDIRRLIETFTDCGLAAAAASPATP